MKTVEFSAPGRCGIVGNPSDIYGGMVVSCSLPARNRCRITWGDGAELPDDPTLWNAATARYALNDAKVEFFSEVPRSSGLAGSTALLAATLAGVLTLRDEAPDLDSLEGQIAFAELLRDIEYHEAGVVCGYQDAYMVVLGGLQRMDFRQKHPATEGGPAGAVTELEASLPLLLITTGVERLSGSVHAPMKERYLHGEEKVVKGMDRVRQLGVLGSEAIKLGKLDLLADCMNENQEIIAELGGSGDPVDELVRACREEGALAAKLAGAGMGGTVIALAEDVGELETRLRKLGYGRFLRPAIQPGLRAEAIQVSA